MQAVRYPHHLLIVPVWGKCSAPSRIHLPSARIGLLNNYAFFRRLGHKAWKDNRQCLNFLAYPTPTMNHHFISVWSPTQSSIYFTCHIKDDLAQSYIQCDKKSNGIKLPFKAFPSHKPFVTLNICKYVHSCAKCTAMFHLNSYTFSPSYIWAKNNICAKKNVCAPEGLP